MILIVGAGFGGILSAVKLIQAGINLDDILIVDPAGGFGGTWYWCAALLILESQVGILILML